MNGAAIECQDHVLLSREDSLTRQSAGYRLEKNHSSHGHYPVDSKTMSYHSSSSFFVGKPTDFSQTTDFLRRDRKCSNSDSCDSRDFSREPLDLPVPRFVIDENYVFDKPLGGEIAKELDLDTRIQLLIRSNALSGVHPIFSDIEESEESNISAKSLKRSKVKEKRRSTEIRRRSFEQEDDPDKPLSTPPSPFLSRAKYLFWFNKAIEIKEQAKEQERALLEIASKKLASNSQAPQTQLVETTLVKPETLKPEGSCMLKSLLDELSKELIEVVKEEFINSMVESTALKVLDDLLEKKGDPLSDLRQEGADLNPSGLSRPGPEVSESSVPVNTKPHFDHSEEYTFVNGSSSTSSDPRNPEENRNNKKELKFETFTVEEERSVKKNNICARERKVSTQTSEEQQEVKKLDLCLPEVYSIKGKSSSVSFGIQDADKSDTDPDVVVVSENVSAIVPETKDTIPVVTTKTS